MDKYNLLMELFHHIGEAEKAVRSFTKGDFSDNIELCSIYFKLSDAMNLVLNCMHEELQVQINSDKEKHNIA